MMYWNEDKTTVPKPIFYQRLENVLNQDRWIIDGNYASTMELRMSACDTVFFLDFPTDICLDGILQRQGKPRSDMPWTESADGTDTEFIEAVKNYNLQSRPQVMKLLKEYSDKEVFIFKTREQADAFLKKYRYEQKMTALT